MTNHQPTPEQLWALRDFAEKNGRNWKSILKDAWASGKDDQLANGGLLRQVRNELGPQWLTTAQV